MLKRLTSTHSSWRNRNKSFLSRARGIPPVIHSHSCCTSWTGGPFQSHRPKLLLWRSPTGGRPPRNLSCQTGFSTVRADGREVQRLSTNQRGLLKMGKIAAAQMRANVAVCPRARSIDAQAGASSQYARGCRVDDKGKRAQADRSNDIRKETQSHLMYTFDLPSAWWAATLSPHRCGHRPCPQQIALVPAVLPETKRTRGPWLPSRT